MRLIAAASDSALRVCVCVLQVLESWDLVFRAGGRLKIRLEDVNLHATETLGALTLTRSHA
jgi:hypothetical protein